MNFQSPGDRRWAFQYCRHGRARKLAMYKVPRTWYTHSIGTGRAPKAEGLGPECMVYTLGPVTEVYTPYTNWAAPTPLAHRHSSKSTGPFSFSLSAPGGLYHAGFSGHGKLPRDFRPRRIERTHRFVRTLGKHILG